MARRRRLGARVSEAPAAPATLEALPLLDARDLIELLRSRQISALETMEACLAQIERLDPLVNAIPTLRPRAALLEEAHEADRRAARGDLGGALHGIPFAIKDLIPTRGLRTTFGSAVYRDFVPTSDELYVERLRKAGAIVIGKTNTPEFGAGSQTFNAVFGATRNPYDLDKTCGGSSGGAAAALASRMLPLADGTDLGGSLRNPASFCNVVGFRPSLGRVPLPGRGADSLGVAGPMARTVADLALLLAVMAGPDPRDPAALTEPGSLFLGDLTEDPTGARVAFSERLGRYPVEREVLDVCAEARRVFTALGCEVVDAEPNIDGVDEMFQTLRAAEFAAKHARDLAEHRALLKDTVVWNIERGLGLSPGQVAAAQSARASLASRVGAFFARHDFLALPTVQVAPFSVDVEWVRDIDGVPMATYIDWMATCYAISCTGLPALSVPCGFTPAGLPVGLQIVGGPGRDLDVLRMGHSFEAHTGHGRRLPSIVSQRT